MYHYYVTACIFNFFPYNIYICRVEEAPVEELVAVGDNDGGKLVEKHVINVLENVVNAANVMENQNANAHVKGALIGVVPVVPAIKL